jgi:hypothetical protein
MGSLAFQQVLGAWRAVRGETLPWGFQERGGGGMGHRVALQGAGEGRGR